MSMSYHIRQLVPRGTAVFLLKRFFFLENGKNGHSLVFTVQIHIKIESLLEYKSVWPSGCVFRSHSWSNLIALVIVSSPDGIQFTYLFSLILNWCTVSHLFIADLSCFVISEVELDS